MSGMMAMMASNVQQTTVAALSPIVTSGLQLNLQTAPTSGTTWTDSSGNSRNATLVGSSSYVSNNGGGIKLNNQDGAGTDYISVPYNITSNTVNNNFLPFTGGTMTTGGINLNINSLTK